MWIKEVAPERILDLFYNYEHALRVSGKGSESGSPNESDHLEKNRLPSAPDVELKSKKPREYFAQPGEAEWGC